MQISKALKRSKVGSIHFRRRLTILLLSILLLVVAVLVVYQGFAQITVAGTDPPPATPTPTPEPVGDTEGGTGGGVGIMVTPEYGFTGGGLVAVIIVFAAFALFAKRKSVFGEKASA